MNNRTPPDIRKDEAFAFQAGIEVHPDSPLLRRPDLRALASDDWDDRVADLQYRENGEFAVGHNVATHVFIEGRECGRVRTCWIPQAEVERVAPPEDLPGLYGMDDLSRLDSAQDARTQLQPMVDGYRAWIVAQRANVPDSPQRR